LREVRLEAGELSGRLLDNVANAARQGSGFNPLYHRDYPGKPIYRPEHVGLNFEHVFNGAAADKDRCMFTPRKDPCTIVKHSGESASLRWNAKDSSWDLDCEMAYRFAAPHAIDLTFSVTPRAERFPLGYVAFMWASYMNCTRERCIHFMGTDGGGDGWISFGEDLGKGFETGTVAYAGVPNLPYEEGTKELNIVEHPAKKFSKPFYYGLIDGDNDLTTTGDTLVYIVMFDREESIRFAEWNFIQDASGQANPHSPAWDWQFVVRDPKPGETYGYRARVIVKPFVSREDVERDYEAWRASLR
ncbi:MAG: hypothetical protein QG656_1978, partial [Candidatus Hydrogenedentes bacterium]|nr:hypothetical protein [Candidatus Hydrogenedentota bacterium]